jgi:hypothetical protein
MRRVIVSAHQFQTVIDRATGQDGLISFLEIGGQMRRRQVMVGLTDHLAHSHEPIVHEESAVHPDIPAVAVFPPCLHIRHDLQ